MAKSTAIFRGKEHGQSRNNRGSKKSRGYGYDWEKLAKAYRAQHPVCESCNEEPSYDVDHKIPFRSLDDPLRLAWENLQALCRRCHNRKTRHGNYCRHATTFVCGLPGSGKSTLVEQSRRKGDLVWDMDKVADVILRGVTEKQRPEDVKFLLFDIRQQFIKRIRGGMLDRPVWVIWSDLEQARAQIDFRAMIVINCWKDETGYHYDRIMK